MKLKLAIGLLTLATIALPVLAAPQDQDKSTDLSTHVATGCLRKGTTANNYALTDENGKTWELRGQNIPLRPHVGHTITVTGTIPANSKNSTDAAAQNHLVVTKVDTVRDNCNQP